jgi:hypothetical protein
MRISGQNQTRVGVGYAMKSKVLLCVAGLLLLNIQSQAKSEENTLSRQIVSRVIVGHLSKVDSYENSWRFQSTRQMVAWLDMWVWRPEWKWTESTYARVWIADLEALAVQFRELRADGNRLAFDVTIDLPLELKARHHACEWVDSEFGAKVQARITLRGTMAIDAGRVREAEFAQVRIGVSDLEFDRAFCQTMRGPIRSTLNCLLEQQQEHLCGVLEARLSGRKLTGLR